MWRNERGGITLEAAIILPFLMVFVLTFIAFIRIQSAHMALQSTVSESTKFVAGHMYPVKLLLDGTADTAAGQWVSKIQDAKSQLQTAAEFTTDFAGLLPEPIGQFMEQFTTALNEGTEEVTHSVKNQLFQPLLNQFAENYALDTDRLELKKVTLPDLSGVGETHFGLEASYKVKLPIPFLTKEITIYKAAEEAVWIGE
ncbi:TadE/TadG family type IV pilus assembly protein [Marinicrinis lubricantis]|uniref:TadE/TadG family type IV pilus assembly protein n=1 Tax=Marinicrinis lubricantis TaxID=2086470 RepID=A0ABW1ITL9_9BACL